MKTASAFRETPQTCPWDWAWRGSNRQHLETSPVSFWSTPPKHTLWWSLPTRPPAQIPGILYLVLPYIVPGTPIIYECRHVSLEPYRQTDSHCRNGFIRLPSPLTSIVNQTTHSAILPEPLSPCSPGSIVLFFPSLKKILLREAKIWTHLSRPSVTQIDSELRLDGWHLSRVAQWGDKVVNGRSRHQDLQRCFYAEKRVSGETKYADKKDPYLWRVRWAIRNSYDSGPSIRHALYRLDVDWSGDPLEYLIWLVTRRQTTYGRKEDRAQRMIEMGRTSRQGHVTKPRPMGCTNPPLTSQSMITSHGKPGERMTEVYSATGSMSICSVKPDSWPLGRRGCQ